MILVRSESPSGKCAKLRTAAASNNRVHMPWSVFATLVVTLNPSHVSISRASTPRSLYYCLFAPHIYGCYSSPTSHSWWIAHSTQRQRRGCNNIPSFSQRNAPIAHSFCEGFHTARPSHPGHSTILLRSESPSLECAKLHTVAASNNRDHMPWSLFASASRYIQSFTR